MRRGVESFFADNDDTIVAYSVRSGFDLLIQALELEPGDEVIFSALNVKGMVRVVRDAGLVPVPVDLDRGSIGPNLEKLQAAITPRSRVFVAAHLFGTRLDLDPLFEFCRNKGIIAVEAHGRLSVGLAADKDLSNRRFRSFRGGSDGRMVRRHGPPTQDSLPFFAGDLFKNDFTY